MEPRTFLDRLESASFSPFMGVPCSVFTPLLNCLGKSGKESYICSSEGEAMGLAGGFALSGRTPVVYMQNDGYGNAVNPLSSLQLLYKLPALLLISWRGFPGKHDAPQHGLMGKTIEELLRIFDIPYTILDKETDHFDEAVRLASEHISAHNTPYAFIVKRGYFEKGEEIEHESENGLNIRLDYIHELTPFLKKDDLVLGTTGFTGRELVQNVPHPGKFYMTGSMGCLSSVGLGVALGNPDKRVFLLDGDGSVLMKMGSLATIGNYSPDNLIHICFDNNAYESTGNQPTVSSVADLSAVADACGYKETLRIDSPEDFRDILENMDHIKKPVFILIRIRPGTMEGLPRPEESCEDMKTAFMTFMTEKK